MLPDRVSNPGPLTYESGALPIALRGPASGSRKFILRYFSRLVFPICTGRSVSAVFAYALSLTLYGYTLMFFFSIFMKGKNFCDFLFASWETNPVQKGVYSYKKRICSCRSKFFSVRVDYQ